MNSHLPRCLVILFAPSWPKLFLLTFKWSELKFLLYIIDDKISSICLLQFVCEILIDLSTFKKKIKIKFKKKTKKKKKKKKYKKKKI